MGSFYPVWRGGKESEGSPTFALVVLNVDRSVLPAPSSLSPTSSTRSEGPENGVLSDQISFLTTVLTHDIIAQLAHFASGIMEIARTHHEDATLTLPFALFFFHLCAIPVPIEHGRGWFTENGRGGYFQFLQHVYSSPTYITANADILIQIMCGRQERRNSFAVIPTSQSTAIMPIVSGDLVTDAGTRNMDAHFRNLVRDS